MPASAGLIRSTNHCGGRVVFSPISSLPPHLDAIIAMMYKLGKIGRYKE